MADEQTKSPDRRNFITKFLTVAIGSCLGLVPAFAGLAVFFDPLRSRKKQANGSDSGGREGFINVAHLDLLEVGTPRRAVVVADRTDAWNFFPDEPVGAVYLYRDENDKVKAYNVVCPHAGCSVDYDGERKLYQCPCHDSSFNLDGSLAKKSSPSPRGLDQLEVDAGKLAKGEVWVKYEKFLGGTAEKIIES